MNLSVEIMADYMALQRLVNSYAIAMDQEDADTLIGLFVENGSLSMSAEHNGSHSPYVLTGKNELRQLLDQRQQYKSTLHVVGTHLCHLDAPDYAHGITYCRSHHVMAAPEERRHVARALSYDDRYIRTSDGWKFESRVIEIFWEELVMNE